MTQIYTEKDFNQAKSNDKLVCKCLLCDNTFKRTKYQIQQALNPKQNRTGFYCSIECRYKATITKQIVSCTYCNNKFEKLPNQIKKSVNHFCSRSCSVTYNNKHKTTGNRRSKLEIYLEEQLISLYPNIEFHFNRKDTINSELDIYIPSLKLAFELNGIFHYEPVFGSDKLSQIQNNDSNKFQKCIEHKISLCIIDTSDQKYFKNITSKKYLDIIVNIINQRTFC